MSSIVSAIGTANPNFCFPQDQILRFMIDSHQLSGNDAARLKKLYSLSGIEKRYSVLPDFGETPGNRSFFGNKKGLEPFPTTAHRGLIYRIEAINLCLKAVDDLRTQYSNLDLPAITHLITVSCTGMYAPGLDIDLVEKLGLNKDIERTCINFMGCYGAFNALKIADHICKANEKARVLVVCAELCTLHFQKENTLENWIANSLFADGAAAVIVESAGKDRPQRGFELKAFHTELFLDAKDEMGWHIGNTGFEMRLSSRIAKNIKANIHGVAKRLLAKAELPLSDISDMAVHPGGRRILEVCEEAFDQSFSLKHSFEVLHSYGNMSSASILFVLREFLEQPEPGANIISFAFGPGLTFESMIVQTL